jgi:hypothetical protein
MKAFLINPFDKTVSEVDYDGQLESIYRLIDASPFSTVNINDQGDVIILDDEGLYRETQAFYTIEGYVTPLAGRGLVLGTDLSNGESIEPQGETLETLQRKVIFLTAHQAYSVAIEADLEAMEYIEQNPRYGMTTFYQPSAPLFKAHCEHDEEGNVI